MTLNTTSTAALTPLNPIIPGFNPDPSICRAGDIFYLVTSSFQFFPGIPVYQSHDLVHWTHIGNLIDRPEQLPELKDTVVNGGIWAPTIRHHNGVYYVVTTLVYADRPPQDFSRWKNFLVTAMNPAGPWSDPLFFDYSGYDTSIFFDNNSSRVFIQGSFYHRIRAEISQLELDLKTGQSLSGEPQRIWSGTGQKAPEAPHLLHKDNWYYLIIAEGGTEFGHRVSMARARNIYAPEDAWEPCPTNPILTHYDLPDEYVQCTGHADLVEDAQGQWWMVLLAARVYDRTIYPMGRETFIIPVTWKDGWPAVERPVRAAINATTHNRNIPGLLQQQSPNPRCAFGSNQKWSMGWLWLRIPDMSKYQLTDTEAGYHYGCLLTSSAQSLSDPLVSPTLVATRQCHVRCRATVQLDLQTLTAQQTGLTAYLDCRHYLSIAVHKQQTSAFILVLDRSGQAEATCALTQHQSVNLAIEAAEREYHFEYLVSTNSQWKRLGSISAKEVSGGFTGVLFGLFAVDRSKKNATAHFQNFIYQVL